MKQEKSYECPVCHLHYEDEATTKECADFCRNNNGCSLDITKRSIERKNATKDSKSLESEK